MIFILSFQVKGQQKWIVEHYSNPDAESLHNDVGKQVIYETLKLVFCLEDVQT